MINEIFINKGELFRCTKKSKKLLCKRGILCITYEHSDDNILKPNDQEEIGKKKNVIVRALSDSVFVIK